MKKFHTEFQYNSRETKARYVWEKYGEILRGSILDVGADECHLRSWLPTDVRYWGIGLGGNPDQQVNLEEEGVPFADESYDCVLCLDVLEHLANPHAVFDELCRVSRNYVIVALPNAWTLLWQIARGWIAHGPLPQTKYYGFPVEPPPDRHKWFFSADEAEAFLVYRAKQNGMTVVQVDDHEYARSWRRRMRNRLARLLLSRAAQRNFFAETVWVVLQKQKPVS